MIEDQLNRLQETMRYLEVIFRIFIADATAEPYVNDLIIPAKTEAENWDIVEGGTITSKTTKIVQHFLQDAFANSSSNFPPLAG